MKHAIAIETHRLHLCRIISTLFAMIGLDDSATVERLAPNIYRSVLRVLRPAESAVRRLIVVAARSITLNPPVKRAASRKALNLPRKLRTRITFKLFDPRPRFMSGGERPPLRLRLVAQPEPRLRVIDVSFDPRVPLFRQPPPVAQATSRKPDITVSAAGLCRRLAAIKSALDNLPRQAKRYARWQSRPLEQRRPRLASALRIGPPPGHRNKPNHQVDDILAECHALAREASPSNTS